MRAPERATIRFGRADRLAGAALAIAVQAALIALLALSGVPPAVVEKTARELVFVLPRLPKIPPPAKVERARKPVSAPATPLPAVPPATAPPTILAIPLAPTPEQLQGLSQSLYGCAPEKWAGLTPSQRAHCPRPGEGVAILSAPDLMGHPDHVKDEEYWEAQWAWEKAPIHSPCPIDLVCYAMMIATGHGDELVDPRKWPAYEIDHLPKNELYKIEQAYDAWNKAHPKPPDATASAPAASP